MNERTLAKKFEKCAQALREGRPGEALQILHTIDRSELTAAAAGLHAHLQIRAERDAQSAAANATMPRALAHLGATAVQSDQAPPLPGVSLVSACMNRQGNLLKVLPTWLESNADEIIIVDWSSSEPLWPMLSHIDDPRLKVIRIENEKRWILTHAFNIALRLARHEVVFKLDADIRIEKDFLLRNPVEPGTFVRGFWKSALDAGQADQVFTNGSFGCRKADLRIAGYYDERILTYGWDDSDLYKRLHSLGMAGHLLAFGSLYHLEQEDAQRLENQTVPKNYFLGRFAPTELENMINKFDTTVNGDWAPYYPPQDFQLVPVVSGHWTGHRLTQRIHMGLPRQLAEVLAIAEYLGSTGDFFPDLQWPVRRGLEFARLFVDARRQTRDLQLAQSIRDKRGIHFFRCAEPALRRAARHTLDLLQVLHPELSGAVLIFEDDGYTPERLNSPPGQHLCASGDLLKNLEEAVQATPFVDISLLEGTLLHGDGSCTSWNFSFDALAQSALKKAEAVTHAAAPHFDPAPRITASSAVVTSVYDEPNLLRLVEMLACVVLNLRVVERTLLCYESRDGSFQMAIQRLCRLLSLPAHRLALLPLEKRPTFEELFAFQSLLPHGTCLAVCNADVAFDASFHRLAAAPGDNLVYAISRWDIADDGRGSMPIRLESGAPNPFSADAWVVKTPFEPDFFLDYHIGTIYCDSFINNQVGRSLRYRVANPCLDVHVFHLHDSRFNSSAEKKHQKDDNDRRWDDEKFRIGEGSPFKGTPWNYLANCTQTADRHFLLEWRPRALVLDIPTFTVGSLAWLHLAAVLVGQAPHITIVVRLPVQDSDSAVPRLLARYKQHHRLTALQFDVAVGDPVSSHPQACIRAADALAFADVLAQQGLQALATRLEAFTQFPADPSISQLRADLRIELDTGAQLSLLRTVAVQAPQLLEELRHFIETLEPWTDERRLLRPFDADLLPATLHAPALHIDGPKVSFVTSMFRGDEFLSGYLENVAYAAIEAEGEVVLVDANCNDRDTPRIEAFFRERPELRPIFEIIRPDTDPGLYACWQLAIERSRGEFVTNANLDDRRSPSHTRRLVELLQSRPDISGACGSISAVTHSTVGGWFDIVPNQVWFQDLGSQDFGFHDLFLFNPDGSVRSQNLMHCMPVWRRTLHEKYGYFDEDRFGTSADWAFWLHCSRGGEKFHLDVQAFGRYYLNPASHNRRNDADGVKERRIISELIGVQQDTLIKQ